MQTEYETIMEFGSFVWTGLPILVHLLAMAAQCFVAGFFIIHGLVLLIAPGAETPWLRRLGAVRPASLDPRGFGFFELALGALVLAPLALRLPVLASGLGCVLALATLLAFGRETGTGRALRTLAAAAVVATLAFMLWERDDPATLTSRILFKAADWRAHELDWQLTNDVKSPKVGDPAPDFELHDPSGEKSVRLSSFFGKRPVALVFGSYT